MARKGSRAPAWRRTQEAAVAAYREGRASRPKRLRCATCGARFEVRPRGALRLHCSGACRQRHYLARLVAKEARRLAAGGAPTALQALQRDHESGRFNDRVDARMLAMFRKVAPAMAEAAEQHDRAEAERQRRERVGRARQNIRLVKGGEPGSETA